MDSRAWLRRVRPPHCEARSRDPRRFRAPRTPALLGSLMDLSFSAEEQAFAAEVRAWLAANVEPTPGFASVEDEVAWGRAWQARLAAGRWVGIHWPEAYGGRGAPPVQVAIFNMEYARSKAP